MKINDIKYIISMCWTTDYLNIAAKRKDKRRKEKKRMIIEIHIAGYILIRSPSFEVRYR